MSTPDLYLKTAFIMNDQGRILSTRGPGRNPGPLFSLIRGATCCAWAVRADVPHELASEIDRLAKCEPPVVDLRAAPVHAHRYMSLLGSRLALGGEAEAKSRQADGLAFTFPDGIAQPDDVVVVNDGRLCEHNFRGWVPGDITAGRAPVLAVVEDGHPVSVCYCARRSEVAAEAGLDTAEAYRGRSFGPRVTAAWALAVRASGLIPLYSTLWTNDASRAVARKLNLVPYASGWSLSA